ncbi:unnamed protein product [Penicillium nalgiovense]|uniref:Uncharacterized protein n=1 Tax=Penicillium nalgiovense TaxID=60175 RepID=A0A9W4I0S2_PENNA|nr:unnamed protein product [Penicillium nalgiovense]CAG7975672.1 unnamed protein product [Penicillium nalgiovense]CAG8030947.1 unnamed protein product [Penicillium nalgiovense]CAG8032124.1 unnamed protein product [Penicillium nalgiovense]CAG8047617.1 unnamed protein product [Penicillium nalgiovense]
MDHSSLKVLIGYTVTAGMVVVTIVFYYLLSYQPCLDPFRDGHIDPLLAIQPRPNPIDELMLRGPRRLLAKILGTNSSGLRIHARFEHSLVKCVLAMSDIQIFTGISIMISGAAQLKCGISCYQWLVVVYLAWFSSLTHLSCLTLLRNYLHNRPAERTWRLVCMFVLVALLFFAFLPTVNYRWQLGRSAEDTGPPTPEDYAICYLKPMSRLDYRAHSLYWEGLNYHADSDHTIVATSISIVLLFVGFVCRVFKLHQSFSKFLDRNIRRRISRSLRIPLRVVCDWCDVQGSPRSLKRYLFYRPLLALFLTARVSADTWNSMFFEVWWLMISFIWGVERLFNTTAIVPSKEDTKWTFGQVMSVALLAIPLVTVIELLYPEPEKQEKDTQQIRRSCLSFDQNQDRSSLECLDELPSPIARDPTRTSHLEVNDHPDYELYYASGSLDAPALTLTLSVVFISLWCLAQASMFKGLLGLGFLQISFYPWGAMPLVLIFSIYNSILFSFMGTGIGAMERGSRETKRFLVQFSHGLVTIFFIAVTVFMFLYIRGGGEWVQWVAVGVFGMYFLCSLFIACR